MSEKHITFENLKTIISPIKQFIENKADWNELKNRPFYTDDNGIVKKLDEKYIPGVLAKYIPSAVTGGWGILSLSNIGSATNFIDSGGRIDTNTFNDECHADSMGKIIDSYSSHANSGGIVTGADYAMASGDNAIASQKYNQVFGAWNVPDEPYYYADPEGGYTSSDSTTSVNLINEINFSIDPLTGTFKTDGTKIDSTTLSKIRDLQVGDKYVKNILSSTEFNQYFEVYKKDSKWIYFHRYTILNDRGQYICIIGNGINAQNLSNAHTIDWNGLGWFAGGLKVGGTGQDDETAKTVATEEYVDTKIDKFKNTPFIEGSGTTDSTAKTSTWIGNSDEITEYYDGLTIRYKIGVAGQSTVTLNINDLGAKTVYRFNTTKLTTQFPVGSIINLIYHADLNDGCWITNDYDANTNTYQRVYESSAKNVEYPITARYATTSGSSYYAEYGRYSAGVTLNPSTNTITATTFNGNLNGTATKALQDSHGNVIVDAYATKNYIQQEITSKTLTLTGIDEEGTSHTWTVYGVAQ